MKRKLAHKKGHKKVALKHKINKHLKHDKKILKHHEAADKKLMKSIKDADHAERKRHKVSAKGIAQHSKHHSKAKHHSKSKKQHKSMCPSEHIKHYSKKGKGKGKIQKVMHEYKEGKLHSGSKKGPIVTNPKQAIAISLSEQRKAGAHIKRKK